MAATPTTIAVLLAGIGLLLVGNGLLAIQLALRAEAEGFSETVTGTVLGGYFVGLLVGTFVCPWVIRAVGHIRTFAAMAALAAVACVAFAPWPEPLWWWFLRIIVGGALVGIYMVVESWLNEQTPGRLRGRVFGLYMTVTLVALGLGLLVAPLVGDPSRVEPFVLASVLFSLGLLPVTLTPIAQPQPIPLPSIGLRGLVRGSPLGLAGALASGFVNGAFWSVGPLFWRGLGLSQQQTSLFMGLVIAGGALLQWPLGHVSDFSDRRTVLVVVSLLAALLVLLTLVVPAGDSVLLALCALGYGGSMLAVYSLSVAHLNDQIPSSKVLEGTRGLLLVYGVGAAIGPVATGALMQAFGHVMLAVTSSIMLGLLGLFGLVRMVWRPGVPVTRQGLFVPLARTSHAVLEMHPEVPERTHSDGSEHAHRDHGPDKGVRP